MLCVIIHNILQLLCICPIRFCTGKLFAVYNPGIPLLSLDAVPKNRTHAKARALYQKNNRHAHQHRPARKAIRQAAQL